MKSFSFFRILVLAGTLALSIASQAKAAVTGGPYIDFKGYLGTDAISPTTPHTITNSTTVYYNSQGGIVTDLASASKLATSDSASNMLGVSYLTYDTPATGADMTLTTIYGLDLYPPVLLVTWS